MILIEHLQNVGENQENNKYLKRGQIISTAFKLEKTLPPTHLTSPMNLIDILLQLPSRGKANKTKTSLLQISEEPKQQFLLYNPYQL